MTVTDKARENWPSIWQMTVTDNVGENWPRIWWMIVWSMEAFELLPGKIRNALRVTAKINPICVTGQQLIQGCCTKQVLGAWLHNEHKMKVNHTLWFRGSGLVRKFGCQKSLRVTGSQTLQIILHIFYCDHTHTHACMHKHTHTHTHTHTHMISRLLQSHWPFIRKPSHFYSPTPLQNTLLSNSFDNNLLTHSFYTIIYWSISLHISLTQFFAQ